MPQKDADDIHLSGNLNKHDFIHSGSNFIDKYLYQIRVGQAYMYITRVHFILKKKL